MPLSWSSVAIAAYAITATAFLAYTVRPYFFSAVQLFRPSAHEYGTYGRRPKVSVLLPLYNESRVVDRALASCSSFNYGNYEIIVVDDSDDGTSERLTKWSSDPRIKVIHRPNRSGWKGGALNEAVKRCDPTSEYCLILDADSLFDKDLLQRFVMKMDEGFDVVQGVQLTDLDSGYSRVAGATSVMQSYYQLIEQPSKGAIGLPVTITGNNFMIKTNLLRKYSFVEDIGEDWDLTIRLLNDGKKIAYAPEIVARCEVPFTMEEAIRQQIRWSEGMVRATLRYLRQIATGDMRLKSKLDIIMTGLSPFVGILFVCSTAIGAWLAFYIPHFDYIVIAVGAFSLLAGLVTMLVSSAKLGMSPVTAILSEIMYFILIPFIIYATFRGMLFDEGTFHRTEKLGGGSL
ncbi:MAG: glycosyltransferase family 2 protein [Thaumarchaeota archaeon]|nr:glycosyltransferase family 2 protein [Nitrososphaerota archaeon]